MRYYLTIGGTFLLCLSLSGCVSPREVQTLQQEKSQLAETAMRLKKANELLANENFTLTGFVQGKTSQVGQQEQRHQEIMTAFQLKYEQLKRDNLELRAQLETKEQENEVLKQKMDTERQTSQKKIDELQEKLRWVYTTYQIRRK